MRNGHAVAFASRATVALRPSNASGCVLQLVLLPLPLPPLGVLVGRDRKSRRAASAAHHNVIIE